MQKLQHCFDISVITLHTFYLRCLLRNLATLGPIPMKMKPFLLTEITKFYFKIVLSYIITNITPVRYNHIDFCTKYQN